MDDTRDSGQIKQKINLPVLFSTVAALGMIVLALRTQGPGQVSVPRSGSAAPTAVSGSFTLPLGRSNLLAAMAEAGAIDWERFSALYQGRGGFSKTELQLISEFNKGEARVTEENSGMFLNLLWALGLANKNPVLESGPMADPRYGSASNFASTGGWTVARGNVMNHYSAHAFVTLTEGQQQMVERVSQNIYRPCCDNPAHFPDCNHGMAMLGLLELLAASGTSEETMYQAALKVNTMWFPGQYAAITRYLGSKGITLATADPKEILGKGYSSSSGFRRVASLAPQTQNSGGGQGGCGLTNPVPQDTNRKGQGGCGL